MQKTGSAGTTDIYRLALGRPVTIETETPLAEKQQLVATETIKAG